MEKRPGRVGPSQMGFARECFDYPGVRTTSWGTSHKPAKPSEWYIVSPENFFKIRWDLFVALLIIYTILVLPWRIGFDQDAVGAALVFEYGVDCCFAIDCVLCFFTGFYSEHGHYENNQWDIAIRYLKTYFIPDVISFIPFELLVAASSLKSLKLLKFIRLVRLMKLMRLMNIQHLLLDRMDVNPHVMRILTLLGKIILLAHLLTCLWHFIALPVCGDDDHPVEKACPEVTAHNAPSSWNWVRKYHVDKFSLAARYIASFHYVIATLMAVGYGDIAATNTTERVVSLMMQLVGATLFGFILSAVTGFVEFANPREMEYKKRMGEINDWLDGREIPRSLKRAVRDHFVYTQTKKSIFNEAEILSNMPAQLRSSIVQHSYPDWLQTLQMAFPREELPLRTECVLQLSPVFLHKGEDLLDLGEISAELYIVLTGCLEVLTDGFLNLETDWAQQSLRLGKRLLQDGRSRGLGTQCGATREILCGLYRQGDLFGQFAGAPILVRTLCPCEVLTVHKEMMFYILSRVSGASQRHQAREAEHLKHLTRVLESDNADEHTILKPCRSLVLLQSVAKPVAEVCDTVNHILSACEGARHDAGHFSHPSCRLSIAAVAASAGGGVGSDGSDSLAVGRACSSGTCGTSNGGGSAGSGNEPITVEPQRTWASVRSLSEDPQALGGRMLQPASRIVNGSHVKVDNILRGTTSTWSRLEGDHHMLVASYSNHATISSTTSTLSSLDNAGPCFDYIVRPNNRHKFRWDLFIGALIMYSVVAIPFRIGFDREASHGELLFDILVDVCFCIDMIVNFITAYRDADGQLVMNPAQIRRHYLKTWFCVDFFSTFPIDRFVEALMQDSGTSTSTQTRAFKLIRIVRLARLLKLVRLLKMQRLLRKIEDTVEISALTLRCFKLVGGLTMIAHLLGCFWYYVSVHSDSGKACDAGQLFCEPGAESRTWWQFVGIQEDETTEQYIAAVYWAFTTMTTVGYGDIQPQNSGERLYAIVSMIGGATIFGYIIGSVAALAGQERGFEALSKKRIRAVRNVCDELNVSKKRSDMIRAHFQYHYQERSPYNELVILENLPCPLRKQVVLHMHRNVLAQIGLFAGVEQRGLPHGPWPDWFVAWAIRILQPQVVTAGEVVLSAEDSTATQEIFFVCEGECDAEEEASGASTALATAAARHPDTGGIGDGGPLPFPLELDHGEPPRTVMVFTPGCLFGLETTFYKGGLSVRCSEFGPSSLYVLRQAAVSELGTCVPEMATALRAAVTHVLVQQVQSGLPFRNLAKRQEAFAAQPDDGSPHSDAVDPT